MPTRHRAQKHTYLGLEYEKSGNQVPRISDFEKNLKDAHKTNVEIGCDTFPTCGSVLKRNRCETTFTKIVTKSSHH